MTKQEYMEFHRACCDKMIDITKKKNSDYTGGSGDPFANFEQIGSLVQVKSVVEIGFLTRMSDKLSRIGSFVTKGFLLVKDESVEDTLLDLANYCILFAGYLRSKRLGAGYSDIRFMKDGKQITGPISEHEVDQILKTRETTTSDIGDACRYALGPDPKSGDAIKHMSDVHRASGYATVPTEGPRQDRGDYQMNPENCQHRWGNHAANPGSWTCNHCGLVRGR